MSDDNRDAADITHMQVMSRLGFEDGELAATVAHEETMGDWENVLVEFRSHNLQFDFELTPGDASRLADKLHEAAEAGMPAEPGEANE
jgi:hypothetical protein